MSELKKNDLVMTEHGLRWAKNYWHDSSELYMVFQIENYNLLGVGNVVPSNEAPPATREQVEAYLKERGFTENQLEHWVKNESQYYIKKLTLEPVRYTVKLEGSIWEEDFDTAPAQLNEAILMAKLLNATKH